MNFMKLLQITRLIACLAIAACVVAGGAGVAAGSPPSVKFQDGRLSLTAYDSSLRSVLESVARASDMEIFVSEECTLGTISIELVRQPLEKALKRILTDLNHVMIYREEQGVVRACALKIFPKGRFGGELIPVHEGISSGRGVTQAAAEVSVTPAAPDREYDNSLPGLSAGAGSGPVVPSRYVPDKEYMGAFSAMSARFEAEEQKAFRELCELKARVARTEQGEEKDGLAAVLTKKLEEFHKLKRINQNRVEALHRLSLVTSDRASAPSN